MNIYDTANKLAYEIKTSNEYVELKKIKEEIFQNPDLKAQLEEFEKARYETQIYVLKGEKTPEEEVKKMQEIYLKLLEKENIKQYFELEVRFNIMLTDINKIIGESVEDLIKI